eukprot:1156461-Pelagomonas_calceolata.AAC.3
MEVGFQERPIGGSGEWHEGQGGENAAFLPPLSAFLMQHAPNLTKLRAALVAEVSCLARPSAALKAASLPRCPSMSYEA